jgi:hypothetical protein
MQEKSMILVSEINKYHQLFAENFAVSILG